MAFHDIETHLVGSALAADRAGGLHAVQPSLSATSADPTQNLPSDHFDTFESELVSDVEVDVNREDHRDQPGPRRDDPEQIPLTRGQRQRRHYHAGLRRQHAKEESLAA